MDDLERMVERIGALEQCVHALTFNVTSLKGKLLDHIEITSEMNRNFEALLVRVERFEDHLRWTMANAKLLP